MLRVAVIGGGPSGSCAAEILAKAGIKTWLFERKLDNAKPCGGAIPLCMVEEFDLPDEIIDRKVRNMKMISPCLLYTSPSPRDQRGSRMPSSA